MVDRTPHPPEPEALAALTAAVDRLTDVIDGRLMDIDADLRQVAELLGPLSHLAGIFGAVDVLAGEVEQRDPARLEQFRRRAA